MLSILIPVFNYQCYKLVCDLHNQAEQACLEYEIVVMDDASTVVFLENELIAQLSNCRYIVSPVNLGRAAVRNALAEESKFPYLLFIDCDAAVCSDSFVLNYLPYFSDNNIICGGCTYTDTLLDPVYSLRWTYGKLREGRCAAEKNKDVHNTFTTFNFLIPKKIFKVIRFDETIKKYGHEDTLFGQTLREKGFHYQHIDNALLHEGLDTNDVFITKAEDSVGSLLYLYKTGQYPFLICQSKLLFVYNRMNENHLRIVIKYLFLCFRSLLRRSLKSIKPSLRLFDIYKLGYLCSLSLHD
jgi:glycosyltransferase involved in cell wall biosynthesis